jgi:hypothetical protein
MRNAGCRGEGEQDAQQRSATGKEQALRQQLADEPLAAGAQSRANCHFPLPRRSARQHQAGEIRANNQHDHAYCACQDQQRGADLAADVFRQGGQPGVKAISPRVLICNLVAKNVRFGLCAAECRPRF